MTIRKYVVVTPNSRVDFLAQTHAQEYFDSLPDGISIDIVDEEVPDPQPFINDEEIPTWRLRAVCEILGLKPQIDAAIAALPEPDSTVAYNAWEYGNTTSRLSPFVLGVQIALNLTDQQVDAIFERAKNIVA